MTYRVEGLIESRIADLGLMKAVEEFAAECSIVKVYATEMLDYVVDEGVQIHGGYGYHQDYAVERAYRDSRINRIFEGTNEINRLLTTGMLLKRAQQGRLGLVKAAKGLMDEVLAGPSLSTDTESDERKLVANAKKIALLLLATAFEKFGVEMDKQQEVLAGIADVLMETLAMESTLLRTEKTNKASDLCAVFLRDAMTRIEGFARPVLAACAEGDTLRSNMAVLRRFAKFEPVNAIALRRGIAAHLCAS
jgi:alkylation response protein AidB-like acyl-CoA dehydrogenase